MARKPKRLPPVPPDPRGIQMLPVSVVVYLPASTHEEFREGVHTAIMSQSYRRALKRAAAKALKIPRAARARISVEQ